MGFFLDVVWVVSSVTNTISGVSYPPNVERPGMTALDLVMVKGAMCPPVVKSVTLISLITSDVTRPTRLISGYNLKVVVPDRERL